MIISPKYKFVFLATEKTGSSSVHYSLESVNDEKLMVGNIVPKDFSYPKSVIGKKLFTWKHTSCGELCDYHELYKKYFKFAFVRNPWDRVVSWYAFSKKIANPPNDRDVSGIDFKTYIKKFKNIWGNDQQNQYEFTKCCDFRGRYENIQQDFDIVCDKIGIPKQQLPHDNKSNHKHYTEYYDNETRQIVAKKYAKDIEYFEYEFGK